MKRIAAMVAALTACAVSASVSAKPPLPHPPRQVGTCVISQVRQVSTRLVDGSNNRPVAGSGSAISLANGLYVVSYDQVPAIDRSRRGDRILACLVSVPKDCPRGDNRGKFYTMTNLRLLESWTLPDSEHMCGGA